MIAFALNIDMLKITTPIGNANPICLLVLNPIGWYTVFLISYCNPTSFIAQATLSNPIIVSPASTQMVANKVPTRASLVQFDNWYDPCISPRKA